MAVVSVRGEVDIDRGRHDGIEDVQCQLDAAFELGGIHEFAVDLQVRQPELPDQPAQVGQTLHGLRVGRNDHNARFREGSDQLAEVRVAAPGEAVDPRESS